MIEQTESLLKQNKELEKQITVFKTRAAKEEAEEKYAKILTKIRGDKDKLTNETKRSNATSHSSLSKARFGLMKVKEEETPIKRMESRYESKEAIPENDDWF